MKYSLLLIATVITNSVLAQPVVKPAAKTILPPAGDTFAVQVFASVANIIRYAENLKKDVAMVTSDLRKTDKKGVPVYSAPFPMPGYTAEFRRKNVNRSGGYVEWEWAARFFDAPRGKESEKINAIRQRADSLVQLFKSHRKDDGLHVVTYLGVYTNAGYTWEPREYGELVVNFTRPSTATEEQAFDSLTTLYKPLLLKPASAEEATEKLVGAFEIEQISRDKVTAFFKSFLPTVANSSTKAAFHVMIQLPYYIKMEDVKDLFTASQSSEIRTFARKVVDDYYASQNKPSDAELVASQQKKQQSEKELNQCDKIKGFSNAYLYRKGITVLKYSGNDMKVRGWVSAIDCAGDKLTIKVPGATSPEGRKKDYEIKVPFAEFGGWSKSLEQYYICKRCGGDGGESVTTTKTRVKELPFGYFEGIRTTSTRTTSETHWQTCYTCNGTGYALEADRDPWNTGRY